MPRSSTFALFVILLIVSLAQGCTPAPSTKDELTNFGLMYYNTQEVLQKPPTEWSQVYRLVDVPDLKEDHDRLKAFENLGYTIVWGVDAKSPNAGSMVLCYSESALKDGGPVLFANGSLREMSGEELASAVK